MSCHVMSLLYCTVLYARCYTSHRKNLILTNVKEERWIDPSDYRYRVGDDDGNDNDDGNAMDIGRVVKVERHISQAMIPGSRLVKVEIATHRYDNIL